MRAVFFVFCFMRNNVLLFCFLLQTKVALLFSVYCKRTEFCCVVVASEWCFDDLYLLQAHQRLLHCRILQKE